MPYQPKRLRIRDLPNGDFVREDEDCAEGWVTELLRSIGVENGFSLEIRREFSESLVALWNEGENEAEAPVQYAVAVEHSPLPKRMQPVLAALVDAWGQALANIGGREVTESTLTQVIDDVQGAWAEADIEGITLTLVCDLTNNVPSGMERGEVRGSALLCTKPEASVINLLGMPVDSIQEGLSWATSVTKEIVIGQDDDGGDEENQI